MLFYLLIGRYHKFNQLFYIRATLWTDRGPMTILKELWTGEIDESEVKTSY
jgi:hypothetical protein